MILWVRGETSVTFYELHQQMQKFQYENCRITVLKNGNQVCIRTSRGFRAGKVILSDEEETEIYDREQNVIVRLLLVIDNQWNHTKKYKVTEKILIGSMEEAAITIHSNHVPEAWIEINPENRRIHCIEDAAFSSMNGKSIQKDCNYQFLDVIDIAKIKIILLEDGIVINDSDFLEVHLQEYYVESQSLPLPSVKICRKLYNRVPEIPDLFVFKKTEPSFLDNGGISTRPLLLEIGPSFLMAIASLMTGFLSAYQAYLNGKEIISLIPMILLPGIMVFSTLLFQPMTRMYEKKQKLLKEKQNSERKEQLLEECRLCFLRYQNTYLEHVDAFYPEMEQLMHRMEQGAVLYQHGNSLRFCIGRRKDNFRYEVIETYVPLVKQMNDAWYPWIIDMKKFPHICISGLQKNESFLNYLILQMSCFLDIPLIVLAEEKWIQERYWLRTVPNTFFCGERMISSDITKVQKWIQNCNKTKFILLNQSGMRDEEKEYYVISIDSQERNCDLTIDLENSCVYDHHLYANHEMQFPEKMKMDMFALLSHLQRNTKRIQKTDFFSVHKIRDMHEVVVEEKWGEEDINQSLKAVIGLDEEGNEIILDFNEKKDGPHGLVAGMTGSGKSELIISMIFSIALQYSWEDVQFSFIDFKGGGIAGALHCLPHVTGVLTNLDSDNLKRALVSYQNECLYRQKQIAQMNQICEEVIVDIVSYRKHLDQYPGFKKIADLIIVVDEFAELKNQQPDFLNDLISISRIGRSLGIHLVLCTQRPTGVISEEIWSNCGFKIALRVAESSDLQEILHVKCENHLREPGDFYLLSRNGLKQGKCAYTGAPYRKNGESVNLVSLDGKYEEIDTNQTISQQQVLLQMFQKQVKGYPDMLWLKPVDHLCREDFKQESTFGIIDDYYFRKQYRFDIFEKRNTVFLTNDLAEKRMCFLDLVSLFLNPHQKKLLFVIDDLSLEMDDLFKQCPFWISYCHSDYDEYVSNIFTYIKNNNEKEKVLMITDVSRFYDADEERKDILKDLLEHAELYHLHVILFSSSITSISYRLLSYVQNKLCLKNENISEIQQFLETNEKVVSLKSGKGLLKKEHVLPFTMLSTSKTELINQIKEMKMDDFKKLVTIPCMPAHIDRCCYHGTEIPLGYSFATYQWITVKPTESVYIVSEYKEEWNAFYKTMKNYAKCTVRGSDEEEDGQLIFLSSQEYRNYHNEEYPVVFIGKSFSRQYTFHSKFEIHNERDAIIFRGYESEKLRVL